MGRLTEAIDYLTVEPSKLAEHKKLYHSFSEDKYARKAYIKESKDIEKNKVKTLFE